MDATNSMGIALDQAPTMSAVLERIANGESLRSVCRDPAMPSTATVMRWIANDSQLQERYARAREAGIDAMAEELLEIADNGTNDWMQRNGDGDEGWQLNGEHTQRSKLRVDARKWLLSKMAPRKYGDRIEITSTNAVQQLSTADLERIASQALTLLPDGTVEGG